MDSKETVSAITSGLARRNDVDLNKIPIKEPFRIFLGNLPCDITEPEIIEFFQELKVRQLFILFFN